MFDIGWTEILVIVCVMIIVVGPKDLPRMLRTIGQTMGKMRRMSREFQSTFNDAIREAEKQADIADMKRDVEAAANFNPLGDLKKAVEEDKATKAVGDKIAASATPAATPNEDGPASKTVSGAIERAAAASASFDAPSPDTATDTPPDTPKTAAERAGPVAEDSKA